jgi:hypothetical protein
MRPDCSGTDLFSWPQPLPDQNWSIPDAPRVKALYLADAFGLLTEPPSSSIAPPTTNPPTAAVYLRFVRKMAISMSTFSASIIRRQHEEAFKHRHCL